MNINNEAKMDLKYLDKLKEIINTIAIPYEFNLDCDKIMFVKSSPYIIGRDENNKYIMKLENFELKERVLEIQSEFENLSSKNYIDNYSILSNLEILVSKYITND